jgi:hypothetical protein
MFNDVVQNLRQREFQSSGIFKRYLPGKARDGTAQRSAHGMRICGESALKSIGQITLPHAAALAKTIQTGPDFCRHCL